MRVLLVLLLGSLVTLPGFAFGESAGEVTPPRAAAPATAQPPERALERIQHAQDAMRRVSTSLQPWHDPSLRRLSQEGMESVIRMRASLASVSQFGEFRDAEARVMAVARQVESTLHSTLLNLETVRNATWSRYEWTRRTLRRDATTQLARIREEMVTAEAAIAEGQLLNAEAAFRQAQFMMSRISLPPGQELPSFSGQEGGRMSPSATRDAVEQLRRDLVLVRRDAGNPPDAAVLNFLLRAESSHRTADWLSRFNRTAEAEAMIDEAYLDLQTILGILDSSS